jgi:carbon-monoxide dehydrogenase medium subunit
LSYEGEEIDMDKAALASHWRHPKFEYLEARSVEEACALLSQYENKARLIAGGTDLLIAMRRGKIAPAYLINVMAIPDLDYIHHDENALRIGALATLSEIESSSLIRDRFPMISDSAHQIGTPQVRNVGTIGGNLCNAAPSADMAPPLIGLGARAKLKGPKGEKAVALEQFFIGPGETRLRVGEMLVEIEIPHPPPHTQGAYLKLPARTAIDLAVVGVAVVVTRDAKGADIRDAKIVLGAVAPTPIRARQAENVINGKAIDEGLTEEAAKIAAREAKPISDVRGSASYRREMVEVLTKGAIRQAIASS